MEYSIAIIACAISVVAYSLSSIYKSALKAIGQNPESAESIQGTLIIGAGLIEVLGLICFALAYLILNK